MTTIVTMTDARMRKQRRIKKPKWEKKQGRKKKSSKVNNRYYYLDKKFEDPSPQKGEQYNVTRLPSAKIS